MSAIFDRIRAGESIDNATMHGVTRAGTRLDLLLDALPIRDADGRVMSAVVVVQDRRILHADAALRESEARWRAVMDSAVDGMIVIDATGASKTSTARPNVCSATAAWGPQRS